MKKNIMKIITLLTIAVTVISCNENRGGNSMDNRTIFEKGNKAGNDYFSNTVWVKMLVIDEEKTFDTQVYNVTFEPAARTHWHSHPGGQILLVTEGNGYYREKGKPARSLKPGDVVPIPADVVHWHGAAPKSEFVHLGMSTQVHLGPAKWLGPVTDQEYSEATAE